MDKVLSQAEIDTLLNAISSGEIDTEGYNVKASLTEIKKYDFRRPNKFTKDQLRTLHMIHENFARMLSNFLSGYLRSSITVNIVSVEQLTYEDFLVSIPSPTLLTIFEMNPLNGSAVMEYSPNFTFPILDLLFGGSGTKQNITRELTEIELSVMRKLNQRILENLAFCWVDLFKFTPRIDSLEINPQFNQIISPNETVAIITFLANISNNQALINLCLPFITLEGILSKLTAQYWFATQKFEDLAQVQDEYKKRLGRVSLDLTARFGEMDLSIRDFLQLREGDVITLDRLVGEDIELLVEGYFKYKIQPGISGQKLAVQVTEKIGGNINK